MRSNSRIQGCAWGAVVLACALVGPLACAPGISPTRISESEISEQESEVYARRLLVEARRLRAQGRLEAAARAAGRGLGFEPDDVKLLRLRAELLEELGRETEARADRERLAELDPPTVLPDTPLLPPQTGAELLVLLLAPPGPSDPEHPLRADRLPPVWPEGEAAAALRERIATRLPGAELRIVEPSQEREHVTSIDEVRRWLGPDAGRPALSLRLDRSYCAVSIKDGRFSVAWLRVAAASGGEEATPPERVREVVEEPEQCRASSVAQGLEFAFELPIVTQLLASMKARNTRAQWSNREVRNLFPRLDRLMEQKLTAGRELLADGRLGDAAAVLREASAIDPTDATAHSLLLDLEASLRLSRELDARKVAAQGPGDWSPAGDPDALAVETNEAEMRAIEARLREERRRREELLAALQSFADGDAPPSTATLAVLRPSEIREPDAIGPRLARTRGDSSERAAPGVERRVLYAPDGNVIARYYFVDGRNEPVLGEADEDADGRPDRWVVYPGAGGREVWQDDDVEGTGHPRVHMIYLKEGDALDSVELDPDRDGVVEQVYHYEAGRLLREKRDTTGDGRFDRFQHFDAAGQLAVREEDLTGNGEIDVRTRYRNGRMVSREILNPAVLTPEGERAAVTPGLHTLR